ncbi:LacI family DNA-binding transcriptional regulator [Sutcliffiella rhizosphaerae]|uniref:HTH-type transcriptional repressor CytR n=1 Tax=Sutcliffiella rhizosphaerae TaxID=2880967 RepID=A0ABN8AA45_9BACI|nr:LacI family DNA-binding transcriptional regulator [Sutcliffiella rhizosphaerae]CAG9620532.1 HTH-type transcriptional repressor CytR [Sutcliffiella rhizosphaerae]
MTTIKDIARVAGVSVTTVSRALNGYSDVNPKTRKRIQEVAKELNYSPNTVARSLVMKKSKTIGLLVSDMNREGVKDNFTFEVLCGINEASAYSEYDLVLFSTTSSKQNEKTYTQLCRERRVDGVILQGIKTDDPYLQEVVDSDIPCVLVDIPMESQTVGYVTTDNIDGAKKAVNHLISCGHKNIAMINGHEKADVSIRRLRGYREALEQNDLTFHPDWLVNGDFKEDEAEKVAKKLLKQYPEISAIFCASDLMALGVLKAAKWLGRKIPEDLAVIGYDDITLAAYSTPSLSTIRQDKFNLGFEAAVLLIDMLEGKKQIHSRIIDTELIIREST